MCILVQNGHFEEAQIMREHELDLKRKLAGPGGMATTKIPLVSVADVEAVVSSWSGVPLQQMSANEISRLNQLEPILKVCHTALVPMFVQRPIARLLLVVHLLFPADVGATAGCSSQQSVNACVATYGSVTSASGQQHCSKQNTQKH